jgi:hypothetical protein
VVQLIALEPDLLFSSKIESIAAMLGVETKIVTSLQALRAALGAEEPKIVVVNLDAFVGQLDSLAELTGTKSFRVVGYYSHVNAELAGEASKMGAALILSRGAFVSKIRDVLTELMSV